MVQSAGQSEIAVHDDHIPVDTRIDDLREKVELLSEIAKSPRPWFKNLSSWLSLLALLFSFGTTYVSYIHTEDQDTHALRAELRTLLQRLVVLPKENLENYKKYSGDPNSVSFLGGFLTQETQLLARQAAEIVKRLPKDRVSATELLAISQGFTTSYNPAAAREMAQRAVEVATDMVDEVAAYRALGSNFLISRKITEGRGQYQKALDIFYRYPDIDDYSKQSTHIWTELNWAGAEASIGEFVAANQHVADAEQIAAKLPPGPATAALKAQITSERDSINSNLGIGPILSGAAVPAAPVGAPSISPAPPASIQFQGERARRTDQ